MGPVTAFYQKTMTDTTTTATNCSLNNNNDDNNTNLMFLFQIYTLLTEQMSPIFLKIIFPYFLKTAILIFVFGILLGHAGSNLPRKSIGIRPGTGSFIGRKVYEHLFRNVGVKGYDSVLGSYSPPIVCLFYLSGFVCVWLSVLSIHEVVSLVYNNYGTIMGSSCISVYVVSGHSIQEDMNRVQSTGIVSLVLCIVGAIVYCKLDRGVSYPGDARRGHKVLKRKAEFDDKVRVLSNTDQRYWHCVVAEESHTISHKKFSCSEELPEDEERKEDLLFHCSNNTIKRESAQVHVSSSGPNGVPEKVYKGLSGESFGRQIWISAATPTHSRTTAEDETKILYYANGGKPYQGFNPATNPNSSDVIFRQQQIRAYLHTYKHHRLPSLQPSSTLKQCIHKACHFYSMLQCNDGHWAGDYGGPHFLLPGLVFSWYIMKCPSNILDTFECDMIIQYLLNHQQSDGGWGTHIESPSTMFGTVLSYVSLRLLGYPASKLTKARAFMNTNGGALQSSSWAKFWLCLLGVMDWKGHNVIPPEMWLLPTWFPFHPSRLWCHCRMVYLPMGFLYGVKFVYPDAETDEVIQALRKEIYTQEEYETIQWSKTRHDIAEVDNYSPISFTMKFLQNIMYIYEQTFVPKYIRPAGIKFCKEYLAAEDLQTNYINIGPVNKVLNMLSAYHMAECNTSEVTVQNHMMRCSDYLWLAEDGMKMQGYNGSQCWDTCFAIQAMKECNLIDEFPDVSQKIWKYLEKTQILSTKTSKSTNAFPFESSSNRSRFFRHVSLGGWPFSTSAHGWPISDCTSEGLKSVLSMLMHSKVIPNAIQSKAIPNISLDRLKDVIEVILTLQNDDGGWATYENNRGFGFYEALNPSEVFGDIMIDYSYVECTAASLTALVEFTEFCSDYKTKQISLAVQKGRQFITNIQRDDGSWYGSWACCFTYGCWFGLEGLVKAGEDVSSSPAIQKAVEFLLDHQHPVSGGWGEDFTSCYNKSYAEEGMQQYGDEHGTSIVNTAWALLALSSIGYCPPDSKTNKSIRRGTLYLMKRQLDTGDFPQEGISGVFNRACGITYTSYRNVFPMWAMGRVLNVYGDDFANNNLEKKELKE